jgi:thioesterase domain-containing protein
MGTISAVANPLVRPRSMPPASSHTSDPKAPHALLLLMEGRAPWELAASLVAAPLFMRLPPGDGHPVLVFPGLSAPDLTTLPLRTFLRSRGYTPYEWEQGFNLGPREGVLERCRERAEILAQKHGEAVSLVGWSLGGIYAREIAKELPQQTRCVITLGTPFSGHPRANNAWRLYELLSGHTLSEADPLIDQVRQAPPVPTTSVYSRTDGVVSWRCSLNDDSPLTENIGVHASHLGLGMNPLALFVVADRLAQKPGEWRPFEAEGLRRWLFKTTPREAVSAGPGQHPS